MNGELNFEIQWMASERALGIAVTDDREETVWLARARTGDEAAYRWLLDRYRLRAVRLAASVLRREGEAEDIAQEAFLQAFRHLADYTGQGRFSAWLFQIVVRRCLDRRRRAWWTREISTEDAPTSYTPETPDTRLLVETLLNRLSPPMRAALVLREMEGLEYEEIAQMLKLPIGTVRSRLHTARAQFRNLWEEAQEDRNA